MSQASKVAPVSSIPDVEKAPGSVFSGWNLKAVTPYGFLLPFLIIFSVFGVFPLLFSVYLSFHEWNPVKVWLRCVT